MGSLRTSASNSQDSADMPMNMTFRKLVALKPRASCVLYMPSECHSHRQICTVLNFAGRHGFQGPLVLPYNPGIPKP